MKVELIKYDNEKLIALGARTCYYSGELSNLNDNLSDEQSGNLIKRLKKMKHGSPFEHVYYTFNIEGISRACMAQLTRHRIASFNVKSQRYVKEDGFKYITPELENDETRQLYVETMNFLQERYNKLILNGVKKEDARLILPNACTTQIMMTINARSLENFFNVRRKADAQWEIRNLANKMFDLVSDIHPNIWN